MAKPIAQTATATKAVTNTQMAVATLAMLAAGGFAYIAAANTSAVTSGTCVDPDATSPFDQNQLFTPTTTPGMKTDYCYTQPSTGKTYLMEGICNAKGQKATWSKNCAELGADYQCQNGACVKASAVDANVVISVLTDADHASGIRMPNANPQPMGEWNFEAQNQDVTFQRLTFQIVNPDGSDATSTANYGIFSLVQDSNYYNPVAMATAVPGTGNGYVRFEGMNLTVPANTSKKLVLAAVVNGSALMDAGSINAFVVRSDDAGDITARSASGNPLMQNQIDAVNGDDRANSRFAQAPYLLFHNTSPDVSVGSFGGSTLDMSSQASIFKFSITNRGDRELIIKKITTSITASGLNSSSTLAVDTGIIKNWELWDANPAGGLGRKLAEYSTCELIGAGKTTVRRCGAATSTDWVEATFDETNDTSANFNFLSISPNTAKTFILTADTTGIFRGMQKSYGVVVVLPKINGTTGFLSGDMVDEKNWANGGIQYMYSPIGRPYLGPFNASMSYPVIGLTLARSL